MTAEKRNRGKRLSWLEEQISARRAGVCCAQHAHAVTITSTSSRSGLLRPRRAILRLIARSHLHSHYEEAGVSCLLCVLHLLHCTRHPCDEARDEYDKVTACQQWHAAVCRGLPSSPWLPRALIGVLSLLVVYLVLSKPGGGDRAQVPPSPMQHACLRHCSSSACPLGQQEPCRLWEGHLARSKEGSAGGRIS